MQQIDNEIKFNTTEMNKVMKSSEKEIKSLDKKQTERRGAPCGTPRLFLSQYKECGAVFLELAAKETL